MTLVHYPFAQIDTLYPGLYVLVKELLMSFIVPIFIFISGCLVNRNLAFKSFVSRKIDGLLKPLLGFLIILMVLNGLLNLFINPITLKEVLKPLTAFVSVFRYGNLGFLNYALWFVPALFMALIMLKITLEIIKIKQVYKYFLLTLLGMALTALYNTEITFYYLSYTPIFYVYLLAGYLFKELSKNYGVAALFSKKIMLIFPILWCLLFLVFSKISLNTQLDLFNFQFNFHYSFLLSLIAILSILVLCSYLVKLNFLNNILIICAKASFFILGLHVYIIDVFQVFFNFKTYNPILHSLLFVINIIMCVLFYKVVILVPIIRLFFFPESAVVLKRLEIELLNKLTNFKWSLINFLLRPKKGRIRPKTKA